MPISLPAGDGLHQSLTFSPNGHILAIGGSDQAVQLWDTLSAQKTHTLEGHKDWINSIAFSPDGRMLASGSGNELRFDKKRDDPGFSLRVWDPFNGTSLMAQTDFAKPVEGVTSTAGGKTLITSDYKGNLKIFNTVTGQPSRSITVDGWYGAFSPDGGILATLMDEHEGIPRGEPGYKMVIGLWEPTSGKLITRLTGHSQLIRAVAFSFDGQTLASASNDRTIRIWNVRTGQIARTIVPSASYRLGDAIEHLALSPNGKMVASSTSFALRIWDTTTGQLLWAPSGDGNYYSLAFSQDGKKFAAAMTQPKEGEVDIWDLSKVIPAKDGNENGSQIH